MHARASSRRRLAAALVAVVAGGLLSGPGLAAPPAQAAPVAAPGSEPTHEPTSEPTSEPTASAARAARAAVATYVVEASSQQASRRAARAVERTGGTVTHRYTKVLAGFAAELTARQARAVDGLRGVRTVAKDREVVANPCFECPPEALTRSYVNNWGLLRLSSRTPVTLTPGQPDGPVYVADSDGEGVTAFVLDSGVDQASELGPVADGYDFVSDDTDASDCSGHGTQVAEVLAGYTTGVAPATRVVPLRVLGCDDRGSWSDVIASLDWAVAHRPAGPAVVNLSASGRAFGIGDRAVRATVRAGLPVVVSAGNDDTDACRRSPARVGSALTVASSTIEDVRAPSSNAGRCVDLFAPGQDVITSSGIVSGTSFAAAHVSGAVARHLENHRRATPAQVDRFLRTNATRGALGDTEGAPNRLLYLPAPVPPSAPRDVEASVDPVTTAVTVTWRAPSDRGSAPITSYEVCLLDQDVITQTLGGQCVATSASARRATLATGSDRITVQRGGTYRVRVAAVGKAGSGTEEVLLRVPPALASKPGISGVIDQEAGGILLFVQPTDQAYDVGPVTGYRFTRSEVDGSNPVSVTIDTRNTFYEFTDIERGRPYRFTAALVTAEGVGAESDPITITYPA